MNNVLHFWPGCYVDKGVKDFPDYGTKRDVRKKVNVDEGQCASSLDRLSAVFFNRLWHYINR